MKCNNHDLMYKNYILQLIMFTNVLFCIFFINRQCLLTIVINYHDNVKAHGLGVFVQLSMH